MQICQIKEFIVPSHLQLSLFWTKSLLAFFYSFPGCPLIPCCNRRQQKRDEWESNSAPKQQRGILSSLQKHPMIKAQITKQRSKPRKKKGIHTVSIWKCTMDWLTSKNFAMALAYLFLPISMPCGIRLVDWFPFASVLKSRKRLTPATLRALSVLVFQILRKKAFMPWDEWWLYFCSSHFNNKSWWKSKEKRYRNVQFLKSLIETQMTPQIFYPFIFQIIVLVISDY